MHFDFFLTSSLKSLQSIQGSPAWRFKIFYICVWVFFLCNLWGKFSKPTPALLQSKVKQSLNAYQKKYDKTQYFSFDMKPFVGLDIGLGFIVENFYRYGLEVEKRPQLILANFGIFNLLSASFAVALFFYFRERSRVTKLSLQNESLKKINERLHRFNGVTSHDILSSLDLILSTGNVLVGKRAPKESLIRYYEMTQLTSRRLKNYCLRLLEETHSITNKEACLNDPMPLVEEILAKHELFLQSKGCSVELEMLSPTPLPLCIVEQVFQNLISNALRYGMGASEPLLRIAEERSLVLHNIRWIVEDNGDGVNILDRELIFNKQGRGKVASQGQNLGLYLLRETLKNYGAKIWVEQRKAGGARFIIDFGSPRNELSYN